MENVITPALKEHIDWTVKQIRRQLPTEQASDKFLREMALANFELTGIAEVTKIERERVQHFKSLSMKRIVTEDREEGFHCIPEPSKLIFKHGAGEWLSFGREIFRQRNRKERASDHLVNVLVSAQMTMSKEFEVEYSARGRTFYLVREFPNESALKRLRSISERE